MTDKTISVKVIGEDSDLTAKLQNGNKKANDLDKKTESSENRLRALWSYGNQLVTMLLQDVAKAAEGTAWAAGMQTAVAILQKAQTQVAIVQTALQAKAAFMAGNPVTATGLSLIAGYMQLNLVRIIDLEHQSKINQTRADEIRRQIDSYRS